MNIPGAPDGGEREPNYSGDVVGAGVAGFGGVTAAPGARGLRTMMMSSRSRAISSPMMRSVELVLMASLLIRLMTWVAEVGWPSPVLPWALTTHWLLCRARPGRHRRDCHRR